MKKAFLLTIICLLIMPTIVFAESWDDFSGIDKAWDGQKSITNQEFEDAINTLEGKKKQQEKKQRNSRTNSFEKQERRRFAFECSCKLDY